jgi:hypothetical protein
MVLIGSNEDAAGRFDDISSLTVAVPSVKLLGLAMPRGWHEPRADCL